jgi:1-aminocyclopropane-1-carboxylate deaminase/D-cysteine desulfhydrase-like pyridoxal-dependent ACC family enzyme
MDAADARARLARVPTWPLGASPSPVEELPRLAAAIGWRGRLLVKRDDALPFAFGGNKVRKLRLVLAQAIEAGADTLVTCGGVQSNHARVTAAAAAVAGMRAVLVANGAPPPKPTANALLDALLGAEVRYVAAREDREPAMEAAARELERAGRRPFIVPLGASTPRGAVGFAQGVGELVDQLAGAPPPDVIVHASSSGGTQAGLVAGCRLFGWPTRVIGVSADEEAGALSALVDRLVAGIAGELGLAPDALAGPAPEVDDGFVGGGYGVPTDASREAAGLAARTEALFVDHTYTAKALAALVAYARDGRFASARTVLFWHTGGQVGLFA